MVWVFSPPYRCSGKILEDTSTWRSLLVLQNISDVRTHLHVLLHSVEAVQQAALLFYMSFLLHEGFLNIF